MENVMYYNLCIRANIDNEDKYLYFDYVEDNKTTLTSTITTHPLVNGDTIADHMYIEPASVNFSGSFSLYGNKKGFDVITYTNKRTSTERTQSYNYSESVNTRLAYIENLFERIKNEGIMCSILKRSNLGDTSRFKARDNMVLTSITWTEKQSSVDFDFTFNEALTASVAELEYDKDITDSSLPILTDPKQSNFTDELLNESDIVNATISILQSEKLFDDKFLPNLLEFIKTYFSGVLVGAVVGAAAILLAAPIVASVVGACAATPPVGWIVLAVIGVACIIAGTIYGIVQFFKKRNYKIKKFKTYKKASKSEAEYNRFLELIGKILERCKQLGDSIKVYGFGTNEPQNCFFNINNNGYYFSFNKRTEESNYGIRVTNFDDEQVRMKPNISEIAISNLNEVNSSNILFERDGVKVYLCNKKREEVKSQETPLTEEEKEAIEKDLTNYLVIVSALDLSKFKEMIQEIIKNEIIA